MKIIKNRERRLQQMKEYRIKNKDKLKLQKKEYYNKNKEIIKMKNQNYKKNHKEKYKKLMKEYWIKNKNFLSSINSKRNRNAWKNMTPNDKKAYWKKKNAWEKQKKKEDSRYAIKKRLRLRVWQAFKGIRKKTSDELGINYNDIVKYLNKNIPADYKNNPSKYEIDHIIPLASFSFDDPEQIKKAFSPENHQWLTSEDNLAKRDKLNWNKPKGL
jgi:hypothetical protein